MIRHERFGQLQETFEYHASGSSLGELASVEDALSRRTSYSDYYRGLPRTTTYADLSTSHQTVDDNGWVTSATDGRGYKTDYQYNNIGWLTRIVPTKNNGPAADTVISYTYNSSGLLQTIDHAHLQTTVQYDGMLRPVLERMRDINLPGSDVYIRSEYDAFNRQTFQSFPSSTPSAPAGIETTYDALGRVTETRQNVAPFAATAYAYLSGNRTQVTDPRGNITTTTYAGFGSPEDGGRVDVPADERRPAPTLIVPPLGDNIVTAYDIWGNPLTVTEGAAVTTIA